MSALPHQQPKSARDNRRVAFATIVGTTVEWYDFFIYANAAGLVFAKLFFEPAGNDIALLISFASVGLSFLFRPLGAFLAGHFGDRLGRRAMLVLTLDPDGCRHHVDRCPPHLRDGRPRCSDLAATPAHPAGHLGRAANGAAPY